MSADEETFVDEVTELEPDDDDDTGTEPEPDDDDAEQEPEQTLPVPEEDTEARMEKINKSLDKLRVHVAKRMGEILGDDAPFYTECELCTPFNTPGFRPPVELPPDVQAHLYHLLGQHSPTDYQKDTHSDACPSCNGFGVVATGSKVIGQDHLTCVECTGNGWLPTDETRRSKIGTAANGPAPTYPPPSAVASALPELPQEEDPDVVRLRQLGYAVIPPMTVAG